MKIAVVLYDGECFFRKTWVCFTKSKLQNNEISFIAFNSIEDIKKLINFN